MCWNHPLTILPTLIHGKMILHKLIPGAKKVVDHCPKAFLSKVWPVELAATVSPGNLLEIEIGCPLSRM